MPRKPLAKAKKTSQKSNTAKTKAFNQDTTTGRIVSKDRVAKDKAGTITQTVNKDNDGVRTDKGGTHQKRSAQETATMETASPLPELPEQESKTVESVFAESAPSAESNTLPANDVPDELESEESANAQSDTVQPAVECLTDRPTRPRGYTCLDEMKEAVEHPERFTDPQLSEIISENNLCANCRAQYDAEVA